MTIAGAVLVGGFVELPQPHVALPSAAPGQASESTARRELPASTENDLALLERSEAPAEPAGTAEPSPPLLAGVARDLEHAPVGALPLGRVGSGADGEAVRTAEDGSFAVRAEDRAFDLASIDPRWCTLVAARVDREVTEPLAVLVAPARRVGGRVVDPEGKPIADAALEMLLSDADRARTLERLASASACEWRCASDAGGAFLFALAPDRSGMLLSVRAQGFRPAEMLVDAAERTNLEMRLEREVAHARVVRGRVVHAGGAPAAGARVAHGAARSTTDAAGRFELELPCALPDLDLVATLEGYQAAIREGWPAPGSDSSATDDLELTLGGPALELAGVLRDSAGVPEKNWRLALIGVHPVDPRALDGATLESAASSARAALRTLDDGSFRIGGLRAANYRVLAWRARGASLAFAVTDWEPAGAQELELALAASESEARARIAFVDGAGATLLGARAGFVGAPALVAADEAGAIELRGAPGTRIPLLVSGESIVPTVHEVELRGAGEALQIVAASRATLHLALRAADGAPHAVSALDSAGQCLPIGEGALASWLAIDGSDVELVLSTASSLHSLSFWRGGTEIGRREVTANEHAIIWP